jgi:hypothetical protein
MRATSLSLFLAGALTIAATPAPARAGTGGAEPSSGDAGAGGAGTAGRTKSGAAPLCDGGFIAEDGGLPVCPSATPDFLSCAVQSGGGADGAGAGVMLLGAALLGACRRTRRASSRR